MMSFRAEISPVSLPREVVDPSLFPENSRSTVSIVSASATSLSSRFLFETPHIPLVTLLHSECGVGGIGSLGFPGGPCVPPSRPAMRSEHFARNDYFDDNSQRSSIRNSKRSTVGPPLLAHLHTVASRDR